MSSKPCVWSPVWLISFFSDLGSSEVVFHSTIPLCSRTAKGRELAHVGEKFYGMVLKTNISAVSGRILINPTPFFHWEKWAHFIFWDLGRRGSLSRWKSNPKTAKIFGKSKKKMFQVLPRKNNGKDDLRWSVQRQSRKTCGHQTVDRSTRVEVNRIFAWQFFQINLQRSL